MSTPGFASTGSDMRLKGLILSTALCAAAYPAAAQVANTYCAQNRPPVRPSRERRIRLRRRLWRARIWRGLWCSGLWRGLRCSGYARATGPVTATALRVTAGATAAIRPRAITVPAARPRPMPSTPSPTARAPCPARKGSRFRPTSPTPPGAGPAPPLEQRLLALLGGDLRRCQPAEQGRPAHRTLGRHPGRLPRRVAADRRLPRHARDLGPPRRTLPLHHRDDRGRHRAPGGVGAARRAPDPDPHPARHHPRLVRDRARRTGHRAAAELARLPHRHATARGEDHLDPAQGEVEKNNWEVGYAGGLEVGIAQARAAFDDGLARLDRDFSGMRRYGELAAAGAVSLPLVKVRATGLKIGKDGDRRRSTSGSSRSSSPRNSWVRPARPPRSRRRSRAMRWTGATNYPDEPITVHGREEVTRLLVHAVSIGASDVIFSPAGRCSPPSTATSAR